MTKKKVRTVGGGKGTGAGKTGLTRKKRKKKLDVNNVFSVESVDEDLSRFEKGAYSFNLPSDVEDDEEIDSDDAFTAEDYEKYGNIGAWRKKEQDSAGHGDASEHTDQDDDAMEAELRLEAEASGAELMNLSDMLDDDEPAASAGPPAAHGKGQKKKKKKKKEKKKKPKGKQQGEGEGKGASATAESRPTQALEAEDSEEEEAAHHAMLQQVQQSLQASATGPDGPSKSKKGKRKLAGVTAMTEVVPESEFAIQAADDSGLGLADLFEPLQSEAGASKLKKHLQLLQQDKATKTLAAPAPEVRREEAERKVGYKSTIEEITRWQPLVDMKRRQATIDFQANVDRMRPSTADLQAKFEPTNSLENDLQQLMQTYGMSEKAMEKAESDELAQQQVSPEQQQKRQAELAKLQRLMFYHQAKARYMNKIKSKGFRRRLKKRKEKEQTKRLAVLQAADPQAYSEHMEKAELARAKERMSLRHKNTSAWVKKQMRRSGPLEASVRQAIGDQHNLGSALRAKQHNLGASGSRPGAQEGDEAEDEEDDEEDEEEHEEGRVLSEEEKAERYREKVLGQLQALQGSLEADGQETQAKSGLFSLQFMKRAMEKQRMDNLANVQQLRKSFEREALREAAEEVRRRQANLELPADADTKTDTSEPSAPAREPKIKDTRLSGRSLVAEKVAFGGASQVRTALSGPLTVNLDVPPALFAMAAEPEMSDGGGGGGEGAGGKSKKRRREEAVEEEEERAWRKEAEAELQEEEEEDQEEEEGEEEEEEKEGKGVRKEAAKQTRQQQQRQQQKAPAMRVTFAQDLSMALVTTTGGDHGQAAKATASSCRPGKEKRQKNKDGASGPDGQGNEAEGEERSVSKYARYDNAEQITKRRPLSGKDGDGAEGEEAGQEGEREEEEREGDEEEEVDNPWMVTAGAKRHAQSKTANKREARLGRLKAHEGKAVQSSELDINATLALEGAQEDERFSLLSSDKRQQELVEQAFSTANTEDVQQDLDKEKSEQVEGALPKKQANTLPGWGNWGGEGAPVVHKSARQKAKEAKEAQSRQSKRRALMAGRKDSKLKHVLISEKVDKKAEKFQVSQVPFPFTSRQQYERSLQTPLGEEWNTYDMHAQLNKPAVIARVGAIINPAKYNSRANYAKQAKAKAINQRKRKGASKGKTGSGGKASDQPPQKKQAT